MFTKNVIYKIGMAMIIGGSLIFVGCQSDAESAVGTETVDEVPRQKFVGILKSHSDGSSGDDFYIDIDGGGDVAVQSLAFDLGSEEYLGNEVEVSGVEADNGSEDFVLEILDMSVLTVMEKDAEWEEFESSKLDVMMGYYSDWEVDESGASVAFSKAIESEEGDSVDAVVVVERISGEPDGFDGYFESEDEFKVDGYKKSRVGVNQMDAFKKTDEEIYYVPVNEYFYQISFDSGVKGDVELDNVFFEMLSSFEVTSGEEANDAEKDGDVDETSEVAEESNDSEADAADEDESMEDEVEGADDEGDDIDYSAEAKLIDGYHKFESLPYEFQAQYPKQWYYSGQKSGDSGVMHQYVFSNEPLDEGGEVLVEFDIMNTPLPSGSTMKVGDHEAVIIDKGSTVEIYVKRGDKSSYRISGPGEFESVMRDMASSIVE